MKCKLRIINSISLFFIFIMHVTINKPIVAEESI